MVDDEFATVTGSLEDSSSGVARVRQLVRVFTPSGTDALSFLLDDRIGACVLGREQATGGLDLPDTRVSRQHARVELGADGEWSVVDLGSRNGVIVDGARRERAPLRHGTVLRLGSCLIVCVDRDLRSDSLLVPESKTVLGTSLAMQLVRGEIVRAAPRALPVLVRGASGVGKERVAAELHRQSGRKGKLVAVNCAAIAPTLAESELFGHVPGAFTGATERSDGLFVAADGGTLFLDEVGELPIALQPKLLRALEDGEIRPVGGTSSRRVDVRVVAATLRDLDQAVTAGSFRGDLLARLSGWKITVPPLGERRDDVVRLASAALARSGSRRLSASAAEALTLYGWPYNVRELEHALASAEARVDHGDDVIRPEHLPEPIGALVLGRGGARPQAAPPPLAVMIDRDAIPSSEDLCKVLAHHGGSVAAVAEFFGRDRRQIYRWLEKHGIDPDDYRPPRDA